MTLIQSHHLVGRGGNGLHALRQQMYQRQGTEIKYQKADAVGGNHFQKARHQRHPQQQPAPAPVFQRQVAPIPQPEQKVQVVEQPRPVVTPVAVVPVADQKPQASVPTPTVATPVAPQPAKTDSKPKTETTQKDTAQKTGSAVKSFGLFGLIGALILAAGTGITLAARRWCCVPKENHSKTEEPKWIKSPLFDK